MAHAVSDAWSEPACGACGDRCDAGRRRCPRHSAAKTPGRRRRASSGVGRRGQRRRQPPRGRHVCLQPHLGLPRFTRIKSRPAGQVDRQPGGDGLARAPRWRAGHPACEFRNGRGGTVPLRRTLGAQLPILGAAPPQEGDIFSPGRPHGGAILSPFPLPSFLAPTFRLSFSAVNSAADLPELRPGSESRARPPRLFLHTSSFETQNSSLLIQNPSLLMQNSSIFIIPVFSTQNLTNPSFKPSI